MSTQRSHTITWGDPFAGPGIARTMSGIEYLRAMSLGVAPAPPIASLIALAFESIDLGRVVMLGRPAEYHYNPLGIIHGGFASTLLDSALGLVTLSILPKGMMFTTLDLHVNFARPIHVDTGEMRCTGEVVHGGKRVVTSFGRLEDKNGKLYAHANATCMVLPWPD